MSGKVDGLTLRTVQGQVIASVRPNPVKREPSAAQELQRERFAFAIAYAKEVLADPCQREVYTVLAKTRKRRVDKLVASDFLTPPEVTRIDLSGFAGADRLIRVLAVDDVQVVGVRVAIRSAAGAVIEEGPATEVHGVWRYTATSAVPAGESVTITASARDRADNVAHLTLAYP